MNKNTQIQRINGNESTTIQKKSKKNKFNKFFTTVSAVMIASSIALSPMTLRADDTDKIDQKKVINALEKEREKAKERIEQIDEVAEARRKVAEYDKKEKEALELKAKYEQQAKEADKKIQEADKKIEENCKGMEKNILLATDYCSKNKCTDEQLKILRETKETYNTECKKLVVKSE